MDSVEYIPQGRLGSHRHGGKLFQIQTEFARRPHTRVTSSVVLDGRIVHKTGCEWTGDLAESDDREALEALIAKQHKATLATVQDRAEEFMGPEPATPVEPGYPTPTIRDTIEEVLRTVPYTIGLYEFDAEGQVVYRRTFRDMVADWEREFVAISSLVFQMPNIIRVGDFCCGLVSFGAENLIAARIRGRAFGILTESTTTIDHLQRDFPEFFEAVDSASDLA
jgi:hypothetical protein